MSKKAKKNAKGAKNVKHAKKSAVEKRAEKIEALDGLEAEARAEAVEAIGDEPEAEVETPAPTEEPEPDAAQLLTELGFEKTGTIIEEIRPKILRLAATTWRDATTDEAKKEAEAVAARAGWFRPPVAVIETTPAPGGAPAP